MKQTLSPFHGYPTTRQDIDGEGNPVFKVDAHYLTPVFAKIADALGTAGMIGGVILGIAGLDDPDAKGGIWIVAVILPLLLLTAVRALCRFFFKSHTRLELTTTHFTVKGGVVSKRFDRALPHKFTLIPHDKGEEEREKHMLAERQAQARGSFVRKKKYYGDAYHLSYEYLGQRNDILTVMGKKDALAIAARLKAIDDVLNANSGRAEGISLTPEDEWDENAGDIE